MLLERLLGKARSLKGALAPPIRLAPRSIGSAEYAASGKGVWLEAFPAATRPAYPARQFGPIDVDFAKGLSAVVPASGVVTGKNLVLVGPHGLVADADADGAILEDHSWYRGYFDTMPPPANPRTLRRLKGRVLALVSDWSPTSYGHFVQDVLPRLAILEALKIDLASFDHIVCGAPTDFCVFLLSRAGVPERKIVKLRSDEAIKADELTIPTFPGSRRGMEKWAGDYIHQLMPPAASPKRRIYVARPSRRPVNEDRLLDIVAKKGFEYYRPELDEANQHKAFGEAEIVIGTAGSALANLVFCKPGTKILELVPTDHTFPYYYAMSWACGLNYNYIGCESLSHRADNSIGPSHSDFNVDEDVFRDALEALVAAE